MNDHDSGHGAHDTGRADRGGRRPFGQGRRPNAADGLEKLFDAFGGARSGGGFERVMRDVASWFEDEVVGQGGRGATVREGRAPETDATGHRDPERAPAAEPDGAARARDDGYDDEDGAASFRGRGPKNYRRTDERVAELVNDALQDDAVLDAGDIEVSVKKGDVTLKGTVARRRLKHRAENVAARAAGAHDVDNRLRVRREADDAGAQGAPGGTPGEAARDADDYGHP